MLVHPNKENIDAVTGGRLEFFLGQAKERVGRFLMYVKGHNENTPPEAGEDLDSAISEGTKVLTPFGEIGLNFIFGIHNGDIAAWAVFSDRDVLADTLEKRVLLAVRLGDNGWVGPHGNGYHDFRGHPSFDAVVSEALGNKVKLNTERLMALQ